MRVFVRRPAVPEERDWEEATEEDAGGETHFGFGDAAVAFGELDDGRVGELRDGDDTEEEAESDTEEGETSHIRLPPVLALENGGDGREQKVEEAVGDGHVEREQRDDGGEDEELQRAEEAVSEDLGPGFRLRVLFVPGDEVLIAGELALDGDLAGDDDTGVRFAVEDPDSGRGDGGNDEKNPVDPPPADTLRQKPAGDRTDDGAEERP